MQNIRNVSSDVIRHATRAAFDYLGLTPRDNQEETCVQILEHFSTGKKYVVLDAPTGSGKSVIGAVVSAAVHIITRTQKSSIIVTATNVLAKQYEADFSNDKGFCFIYGAANYPCELKNRIFKKPEHYTAESCYKKSRFFYKLADASPTILDAPECRGCTFAKSRAEKASESFAVTNYSYFILDRLYVKLKVEVDHFDRPLYVFDEAHLLNELFVNHCAIYFSAERSRQFLSDIRFMVGEDSNLEAAYANVFRIILENIERSTIGNVNVDKFLQMLMRFYSKMMEIAENKKNMAYDESLYDRYGELYHKYHGLFCKIDDYFKYGFEIAVDCNKADASLTVKPIFVKNSFKEIETEHNLFMSATIDDKVLIDTLCLDPAKTVLVKVPYAFNADDKTVVVNTKTLIKVNYETLKLDVTYETLGAEIVDIAKKHQGENGIVVCTSFAMCARLYEFLKGKVDHDLMLHRQGTKLDEVMKRFVNAGKPSLLLSPSLFEGVDLAGKISQFQIIAKAPFYSLADKRIKKIMKNHRGVYNAMTTMRLIQALGRSTRFKGDKSTSYFLDKNLVRAFNSRHNRWKNQFNVIKK